MNAPSLARSSAQLRLRSGAARLFWPAGDVAALRRAGVVVHEFDDVGDLAGLGLAPLERSDGRP